MSSRTEYVVWTSVAVACFLLMMGALLLAIWRDADWNHKCEALGGVSTGYTCVKGEVVAVR